MKKHKLLLIVQSVLCILFAVMLSALVIRIYRDGLADQKNGQPEAWIYTREKAGSILLTCLPVFLLAAGTTIVSLLRGVRVQEKAVNLPAHKMGRSAAADSRSRAVPIARAAVLTAAVLCIVLGIFNGSMRDVLYKAVNICTECIGLG